MKLFCFGLGFSASHLIHTLSDEKWQYSGTHREKGDIIFNGDAALKNAADHLKDVTHLLISIPPDVEKIDPVLFHHKKETLNAPKLKWIGYLSATSVYGDHDGQLVDENTPTSPSNERGLLRLKAEQSWLSLGLPVHIFRLGGIYGNQRNQIKSVIDGTAKKIIKENHTFSRIHVNDIATALKLSMLAPGPGIYNIVDDQPTSSADVIDFISEKLGHKKLPAINFENADISPMMKSFYHDNKRVKNDRLKETFNWKPKYPTYKEGYLDILNKLGNRPL